MSKPVRFAWAMAAVAALSAPHAVRADALAPQPREGLVVIAVSGPGDFGRSYSLVWRPIGEEGHCPTLADHGGFTAPLSSATGQPWRFRVLRVRPGRYGLSSIAWLRMGFMTLSGEEPVGGARPVIKVAEGETVFAGAFRVREAQPRHPVAEPVTNVAPAEVDAAKVAAQAVIDRSGQKLETAGPACKKP